MNSTLLTLLLITSLTTTTLAAGFETRTIRLENTASGDLTPPLQALFAKARPLLTITGDAKANSLTLSGPSNDVEFVNSLLRELDLAYLTTCVTLETEVVRTEGPQDKRETDTLSLPTVSTCNGHEAKTLVLTEMAVAVPGAEASTSISMDAGIIFTVTPLFLDGQLFLKGMIRVTSEPSMTNTISNGSGAIAVLQPMELPFSVKLADPSAPCQLGPVTNQAGDSIYVTIRAKIGQAGQPPMADRPNASAIADKRRERKEHRASQAK